MQTAGAKGVHLQGQPGAGPGKTIRGSVRGFVRDTSTPRSATSRLAAHRGVTRPLGL